MSDLSFQYPAWYIIGCILLGIILASVLYVRTSNLKDAPTWVKPLLWLLRATGVALLAMLLLHPFLRTSVEESTRPIAVIAEDGSESIAVEMMEDEQVQYHASMDNLASTLSTKYDVRRLSFGESVRTSTLDSFSDQSTNISSLMDYVYDNYSDQNLGVVVLSSDGIFNEGYNPIYQQGSLKAPVYTIAMGDTTIRRDVYIQNVLYNKIAYLNDKFVIQVDVKGDNAKGTSTLLTVSKGNKTVHRQRIKITDDSFFKSFDITLDANQVGISTYRVRLSPITEELSTSNNVKDIYVEVLDDRQQVLIVADGVHPDIGALRTIITSNKNYEVEIKQPKDNIANIKDYDVVIMHNLPSTKYPKTKLFKALSENKIPVLYNVGVKTDLRAFSNLQSSLKISGRTGSTELIQGVYDPSFTAFKVDEKLIRQVGKMPPMIAPFGDYTTSGRANVFLRQRIKKVDTETPMLLFGNDEGQRHAILIGEGIWKWRLYNYSKDQNYDVVTELINKTIQRITVKEDKRKFRVQVAKNAFKVNESVYFDAQVYNENYELVNEGEVSIKVYDSAKKAYDFVFTKENNYYILNAGRLPADNYRFTAETTYEGKKLQVDGRFSVQEIQLESYDLTARHFILNELAEKTGGSMLMPSDINSLSQVLLNSNSAKPILYERSKIQSLLDYKWLFALIAGLFCTEWFIRRFFGSY